MEQFWGVDAINAVINIDRFFKILSRQRRFRFAGTYIYENVKGNFQFSFPCASRPDDRDECRVLGRTTTLYKLMSVTSRALLSRFVKDVISGTEKIIIIKVTKTSSSVLLHEGISIVEQSAVGRGIVEVERFRIILYYVPRECELRFVVFNDSISTQNSNFEVKFFSREVKVNIS